MASANSFGFTGRENDETGVNYYRARYYDPRFNGSSAKIHLALATA
jgi:RHS repeat-associated protein